MRNYVLSFALCAFLFNAAPADAATDPHAVLARAMTAMGGAQRLRDVNAIEYTAVGERPLVEQSERPTGPYLLDHFRMHEIRDVAGDRTRIEQTDEGYASAHWWTKGQPRMPVFVLNGDFSASVNDGKFSYAGHYLVEENQDERAFGPERVLLTADAAPDLRELPDVRMHGVVHHVLTFHYHGEPCTLYINADANLPWQISYTRAYAYSFLHPWGDVNTTVTFSEWSLEPFGIAYPRERTYQRVGLPDQQISIVDLTVNPQLDDASLTIPHDILPAHPHATTIDDVPLGYGGSGAPHELALGITEYPGGWNVAFVKQDDGIVMIEAPLSTGYTKRALEAGQKTYGLPVKAVITTSDSWPHIAGVRQAVAQGIPIYALDLNRPILERLIAAPHTMLPDDLQRHPRAAKFVFVSKPTTIGSGPNRLTIYPYRSITAERQMMVYFPERRLLYTSDLFTVHLAPDDWFTPQYLHEAIDAITRYGLTPQTIFGMHYDATPYQKIVDIVEKWTRSKPGA